MLVCEPGVQEGLVLVYNLLIIFMCFVLFGCSSPSSSRVASAENKLRLAGKVVGEAGLPRSYTAFLGGASPRQVDIDALGRFKIDYRLDELQPRGFLRLADENLQLLLTQDGYTGISKPFYTLAEGPIELGDVAMGFSNQYTGHVEVSELGGATAPAVGVEVAYFGAKTLTDENGLFVLEGLPEGDSQVSLSKPGLESIMVSVRFLNSKQVLGPEKVFLFYEGAVAGVLNIRPPQLKVANKPYQMFFEVFSGLKAPMIRYHDDQEVLLGESYRPARRSFYYDFGKPTSKLYYQFASQDLKLSSDVFSIDLPFVMETIQPGLIIADGSGQIEALTVPIRVIAPIGSRGVRYSDDLNDFQEGSGLPWRNSAADLDFTFPPISASKPSVRYELFAQFLLSNGELSSIYSNSVDFVPFPKREGAVISVPEFPTQVNLVRDFVLDVPPAAAEMRVWEEITEGGGIRFELSAITLLRRPELQDRWVNTQPILPFRFIREGVYNILVQFRTKDKLVSPIYPHPFVFRPLENVPVGFVMNGGYFYSPVRTVGISLIPPPGASGLKITLDKRDLNRDAGEFLPDIRAIEPRNFLFDVATDGLSSVYVMYYDAGNRALNVHERQVFVDPLMGDFVINGGLATTTSPLVVVELRPPPGALGFQVYEEGVGVNVNFRALESSFEFALSTEIGRKDVQVRYSLPGERLTVPVQRTVELIQAPSP